ncbi:ABC transporter ATP-binding protein [Paenirhodobacter populi]|uniref:Glutathione import ATP-binding protein GsiA n=1 Tax=Paenirhodobacter populi TaxID=2306993 RepID=A0A443JLA0_9RHOB|nr:ABC transporter ATP-binding protein [Sinirhodobacter populi]RWR21427.1 ABC transporter ATP-binding protein [Sinirhodobacter populi]
MTDQNEPLLSVRNLRVSLPTEDGAAEILHGIDFDLNRNEILAVVGESGSGKSVTALTLMGLLPARVSGSVRFDGRELTGLTREEMRQLRGRGIAMIFQEPMTSLNPLLKVGYQLEEALRAHERMDRRTARARALDLMRKVRIPDPERRMDSYPHHFSGGMRQRVMIAMALAGRPKLLIADEPTTALDVTIQAEILELIRDLQRLEGMAVLFITHDMGVVAEIADRTMVMYHGRAVETGPTDEVFAAPKADYTRALLDAVPRLGEMAGHDGPQRFRGLAGTGTPVAPRSADLKKPQTVLDVRHLQKRFEIKGGIFGRVTGRVHAIEDVSFSLMSGETLALVGESGCGKSTTGRAISRLIEADGGSVMLDGFDALNVSGADLRRMRRSVQMIFQDPYASLNPRIRIGASLCEAYLVNRLGSPAEAQDKAAHLLTKVGLNPDVARRFPHEFSGGQRQRIAIARALMLDPRVIVADEAVSALDVSVKAQVSNLLMDLQEETGVGYLFISHDMAVVERIAHRVAVMYSGRIVEIGPRAAVFGTPSHPYTRRLLSAVPVPDPARRRAAHAPAPFETRSPIRPPGHVTPPLRYREVAPGHLVEETSMSEFART